MNTGSGVSQGEGSVRDLDIVKACLTRTEVSLAEAQALLDQGFAPTASRCVAADDR